LYSRIARTHLFVTKKIGCGTSHKCTNLNNCYKVQGVCMCVFMCVCMSVYVKCFIKATLNLAFLFFRLSDCCHHNEDC
jgi:hypothetical protein